jgi:hypothetical protein
MPFDIKGDPVAHLESCGMAFRTLIIQHKADLPLLLFLIFSLPALIRLGHLSL